MSSTDSSKIGQVERADYELHDGNHEQLGPDPDCPKKGHTILTANKMGSLASDEENSKTTITGRAIQEEKFEEEARNAHRFDFLRDSQEIDVKQNDDVEQYSSPSEQIAIQDPNIVDWEGLNDPENPLNWPLYTKIGAISVVSFITFLSPLASTIIAPGVEAVQAEFNSDNITLASFITSAYLLGYCFGPLVLAPLSELYGRILLYNVSNLIFLVFNIACARSPSLGSLVVFRLLAGIAGSCPLTIGAGSIADMIPHESRGLAMSAWILGPLLGPAIGPLAGGYLTEAKGWRWTFWVLAIVGGAVAVITISFMRESYAYTILERKTKRLRKSTGNPNLRSALDTGRSPKALFTFSIVRPLKMLFLSPIVFLLSLYTSTIYAYLYLCFTTFPRIFQKQYEFSEGSSGLVYLGIGIGSILGLFLAGGISDRLVRFLAQRNGGKPKPEYRLPMMVIGGFLVPIGLPIIGTGFLGGGMVIAYMASSTYLVDAYTLYAASAIAASTVFRSLLGALLPLAGGKMYDSLGIGWGTSVLAFISVGMLPLPFIFFKYGERIRESKLFHVEF